MDTSGRVSNLEVNFQDGVSSIVSAINAKAGSSLTGASTPEEIVEVVNNIKLGPDHVPTANLHATITLKNTSEKTNIDSEVIDITNWKEMRCVVRKTGSGWGNLPIGGVYIENGNGTYKQTSAYISGSDAMIELSDPIDVSNYIHLKVRLVKAQHTSASSSNPYSQGIRAYIFYCTLN